ncbi:hypothetical protein HPB51_007031 [Rhipicephalus microplus]|uniref:CCHC-type domain-containing protein n=1 Tax=Rhipicephalus microplus TaxID=6941 RepID=A0A9J6DZW5_RHIMP|nr:hypothetical protein HPB51_007031 [Rhipicephalus microplus]
MHLLVSYQPVVWNARSNRRDRTRLHRAPEFSDVSVGRRAIAQDFLYEWFLQIIPVPRIQLSDRYWSQFSSKLFIFSRHAGKIRHWTPKPSDATPNAAVAAAGTLADMEIEVDGVEISLEEWSDDSWTPPQGFRAQAKRHQALKQQAQMNDAQVSKAPKTPPTPRPPPELKRHPLPRLPSHTYHIVGRPKTPIDLTRTSPGDLQRALLKAASLCDLDPAKRDQLRIHPRNNTFTVSVATTDRAIAYQRITSILLGEDRQIELHMYAPPPDDAIRGISFYAHTFPTDDETLKDLQDSNPDYQIVGGRRMGKTKNLLITLLGDHLPRWLLHRGGLIRVYPFHPKVDACFNCRKTGHRSDVCPQPRHRRCPRCGEDHEPPPQGTPPTCQARCIVCQGGHMTNSSRCEYRFAKKSEPLNAAQAGKTLQTESPATQQTSNDDSPPALDERNYPSFGTSQTPTKRDSRSKSRSRQGQAASHSRSKSRTRSSSRIPHADISKAPPSNPSVAWAPSAASPLPSSPPQPSKPCASTHDPLVKELTQTINALKSQMATQQAQIEVLLAQNRSLESKLAKASQSVHNSTQQPQPPAAAKRKATTSTETLQSDDDDPRLIQLIWVPAHAGNPGNEAAHRQARGLVCRAVGQTSDHDIEATEALITFHDITQYYKLSRQTRPPPHPELNKAQQITWRRLQTNSFPSPYIYRHIYPALFTSTCTLCKTQTATLDHIIWGCSKDPPPPNLLGQSPSSEAWERILTTTSLDTQLRAIKRADEVATRHGLTALAT